MKKTFKNDIILILLLLVVSVFAGFLCLADTDKGERAVVIQNGKEIASFSLKENITHPIENQWGKNTLVVEDGFAYVKEASCPDKICVHHQRVNKAGETIVCLPNKLVVEIRGHGQ